MRIASDPRIFDPPAAVSAAWSQVESWLAAKSAWITLRTDQHQQTLAPLMLRVDGRASLVPDAHLAALAIEHGLVLCSTDGDCDRFEGLEWLNPLL